MRLKYKFISGLIETEPGEVLELKQLAERNATLKLEIERTRGTYTLNFTIHVVGHSVHNEDGRRAFREFRKCAVFEYDATLKSSTGRGRMWEFCFRCFNP